MEQEVNLDQQVFDSRPNSAIERINLSDISAIAWEIFERKELNFELIFESQDPTRYFSMESECLKHLKVVRC